MKLEIAYDIVEVPTFELRRIIKNDDKRKVGHIGPFKTRKEAEDFRDSLTVIDAEEWEPPLG